MGDFNNQIIFSFLTILEESFPPTDLEGTLHNRPSSVRGLPDAASGELEKSISTSSVTTESCSSVTGTTNHDLTKRDAAMADLEHLVSSYTHSLVDTSMTAHENPTSHNTATDCPSEHETNSVLKDTSGKRHLDLDMVKREPQRKNIKLSKTMKIPVEDVFSGVHTRLCKSDCMITHHPLVLATCAHDDFKLRNSLENYFKLAIKFGWKSAKDFQDHDSELEIYHLVHAAVLFANCDLLEFLLQSFVDDSELFVDSAQNSPLHSLIMCMDYFMPSSSHDEKVATFQCILQLITKYNCNALLVRNNTHGDTVLHACVKQIRKLTMEIKPLESVTDKSSELQRLIDTQQLVEIFFKEMISTLKGLCADGSLDYNQVIELFECTNKAGETMLQILKEDESVRNNSRNVHCQERATILAKNGSAEHREHQTCINKELSGSSNTDEHSSMLSTVSKPSLTVQNGNDQVLTEPSNSTLHTGTGTSSTDHLSIQAPKSQSIPTTLPKPTTTSGALTQSGISTAATKLRTGRPKPAVLGRHTFLCSDSCTVKHHKLIQLLCATPDHLSNDSETVELKSCREFKKYLEDTHWDINTVVPDDMPSLCYPIVHLACLLGKHKALTVLSELGFHPLVHANVDEETPLHMTVRLLHYQTSSPLFLSNVVVSIVKTLSQHGRAISLFSAKDKSGNSVLHAMAKVIGDSIVDSPAAVLHMYVFRAFIHFLLKGQHAVAPSACVQVMSSCLKDCNKVGQDVEFLLQRSNHGQQLLEYLGNLMQRAKQEMSARASSLTALTLQHGTNEEAVSQKEGKDESDRQIQCASPSFSHVDLPSANEDNCGHQREQHITSTNDKHGRHTVGMAVQLLNEEPESLVDFILSDDCKISHQSKKWIMEYYITEYDNRIPNIADRAQMLREVTPDIKWHTRKMNLKRGEWQSKQKQQSLVEKIIKACDEKKIQEEF